jgi:hypothetical protein
MSMALRRLLLAAAAALALAGCDETRFAADPLGETRACESTLEGVWRIEDDKDSPAEYFAVSANCDVRLLRPPRAGEGGIDADAEARPPVELAPSIGRIDGRLYAVLTDDDFHRAADGDDAAGERGHETARGGFHAWRIELDGNRALLRTVDHRAVARAIIDGKLEGEVAKNDDGLKNWVALDRDALRELLGQRWLFRRDDPLRLARVDPASLPPGMRAQSGPDR